MFEKIEVNGESTHPLYVYLRMHSELGNKETMEMGVVPWNFAKFVVDRNGEVVKFFGPMADFS